MSASTTPALLLLVLLASARMEALTADPLLGHVAAVQSAAEAGDNAGFRSARVRLAEALLLLLPERSVAEPLAASYRDLDRIWSWQLDSPAGSFFGASSGLVTVMERYPGYRPFISGKTLTVAGETLYPTRETRDFLVRECARHLAAAQKE